jgi:hypothetical protein
MNWQDYVNEVKEKGFEQSSPIARLIWSCEVGHIDQHASDDLIKIMGQIEALNVAVELLKAAKDLLDGTHNLCDKVDSEEWLWKWRVRYFLEETDIPVHEMPKDMQEEA